MGGPYTEGEQFCAICDKQIKDGDWLVVYDEGQYNEEEEVINFEPYTESIGHKECFEQVLAEGLKAVAKRKLN